MAVFGRVPRQNQIHSAKPLCRKPFPQKHKQASDRILAGHKDKALVWPGLAGSGRLPLLVRATEQGRWPVSLANQPPIID